MHSVELLDQALSVARLLGYEVRQEWLGGGGGACELRGHKCLFVDLALSPLEQLRQVLDAIGHDPCFEALVHAPPLEQLAALRKSA